MGDALITLALVLGALLVGWSVSQSSIKKDTPKLPQYNIICQAVSDGSVTLACVATPEESK
jgi:hypothetical protein